ncbi:MAG: M23 family metallopeptidase [Bacteroidetes bacterium]|nr:M23 family metallopeptidase [Bacteroidota bacterium]
MAKNKYRFNPETLSYDKVDHSFIKRLLRFFPLALSSCFIALILYFVVFAYFFDSPKERKLRREIVHLLSQYEVLNIELDRAKDVLSDIQYRDDNIYRTIFEAEPIPREVREAGFGGVNRYDHLQGFGFSDIVIETTRKLDILLTQLYIQSKSYDEVTDLAKNKEHYLASVPAIQPVLNKDLTRIASYFGWRNDPVYKGTKKMHEGIDFTAPVGTEIFATGDGVIEEVKLSRRGYGNQILIDHGYGYKTRYAHLQRVKVIEGQQVRRGEMIGTVGNTGKSVGPHLHYEVLKNNKAINPINYFYQDLTPAEYDRMIELSSQEGSQTLD